MIRKPRLLLVALMMTMIAACAEAPAPEAEPLIAVVPASADVTETSPSPAPQVVVSGLPDFSELVRAYGPAVVNVATVTRSTSRAGGPNLDPDDPMHEFFRRFGFGAPRNGPPPTARGEGSGFIVSSDGYLLTNAHVVDGATEVTVRMTDRREYLARVVGVDTRTDVAVLKIAAQGLPVVRLGKPDSLRAGEWVIAIGSPFGFDNSVTAGIVSATARSLPGDAYTPFIQTDVAVNPGNSGGPLFNLQGEVVGINSQIYSRTGGYQGVSFAIPIDVAINVKQQLVTSGRVERGRIGVTIQDINQPLADSFGLQRPQGALVSSVERRGPADKAGVKAGDVILGVNDKAVERSGELPAMIAAIKPGTEAALQIWRDKSSRKLKIRIGELEEESVAAARPARSEQADDSRMGLVVRELTSRDRARLSTAAAIVVDEVDGPAALAGVEPGDLILAVNGAQVSTVAEFRGAVSGVAGTIALLIQRGDAQIYIPVRVS